jgi:hypothetical protein
MSALPPKADMCGAATDVRFGPIADIALATPFGRKRPPTEAASIVHNVRFTPESRHLHLIWNRLPEESGAECSLRPYSSPVVPSPIAMAPIVRPRSISVAVVTVVVRLPPASVWATDPAHVLHVGWSGCCYWCDWRCGCGVNGQRTTTRSSCDKQLHFVHGFSSLDAPLGLKRTKIFGRTSSIR